MSKSKKPKVGSINWFDLTVRNADKVRAFYESVVGWNADTFDMGGYNDFCMKSPGGRKTVAGICHARGDNVGLPPQWLLYITVANLNASVKACRKNGGKILRAPRAVGGGRMAVIRDPAGAIAALYQP